MTWVQYSPGAFVYGSTEIRVTPERSRLRDVYVCTECAASLRGRLAMLIEQGGQPARAYRDAAGG